MLVKGATDVNIYKLPTQNRFNYNYLVVRHLMALKRLIKHMLLRSFLRSWDRLWISNLAGSLTLFITVLTTFIINEKTAANGKVQNRDGSQFLVKHGGSHVRVHPCKLHLADPLTLDDICVKSDQCVLATVIPTTGFDVVRPLITILLLTK